VSSLLINPGTFPGAWGWLGIVVILAGVLVCGRLAFVLVERPGQRLMRSMVKRPRRAPAEPVTERTEEAVEERAPSGR
jgi:peptidoglycan/LPS O-acetylase OafA/YrhL